MYSPNAVNAKYGNIPTAQQEYGAWNIGAVDANQLNKASSTPKVEQGKADKPRVPGAQQQTIIQAPPVRGCYW